MMLSKNNRQLINRMNAKRRQRFGLRKLTVGVASVLLGTTFFLGGEVANADTVSATNNANTVSATDQATTSQITVSTNHIPAGNNSQQSQQVTLTKTTNFQSNPRTTQTVSNGDTQQMQVTTSEQPFSAAELRQSNINPYDGTEPVFSGTVNWTPHASYHAGETDNLSYVLQTGPGSNSGRSVTFDRPSKYLLVIPSGFNASLRDFTIVSGNDSRYQFDISKIQDLGMVGQHGEHVFLLPLAQTPSYQIPLVIKVKITDNGNNGGYHSYGGWSSDQLLLGINQNLLPDFAGYGGQTFTYNLGGHTYTAYSSTNPVNSAQLGTAQYTAIPGNQPLASGNFHVDLPAATKNNVQGLGNAGYEEINPTINITGNVQAGDYIDFRLGIPYTDSQGQTAYELYDRKLADNFTVNNIGTVYNMGDYYRLVFSSAAETLNHPTFDLQLRWGSPDNTATLNKGDAIYIYRPTDDPSKYRTTFTYQPTNDVTINGKSYSSGFTVNGAYVYVARPIATGNQQVGAGSSASYNRTWNQQGDVSVNTHWSSAQAAALSTTASGDEFDLKTTITKDPSGLVSYVFTSADAMKQAIENDIATLDTHQLTEPVQGANGTFVNLQTTRGHKPRVNVDVTRNITTDPNDPNRETATWHIKLANADPASTAKIMLTGSVVTVTASAENFTMPEGITSYQQDLDNQVHTNNYNGAKTDNEPLMNVLKNLPVALTQFVSYKNGQPDIYSKPFGGPWNANIAYVGDSKVDGGGSATDLVTATIKIEDEQGNELTTAGLSFQGPTGSTIKFDGLQAAYNQLTSNYTFDHAVSVDKNGNKTRLTDLDLNSLNSYSFGTANKNYPTQFIIYMKKNQPQQNQQTATVKFVDDTDSHNNLSSYTLNASGNEGTAISFDSLTQKVDELTGLHYVVKSVTEGTNQLFDGQGSVDWSNIFGNYGSTSSNFVVHLVHDIKPAPNTNKVTETVHYLGITEPAKQLPDTVKTVTFTQNNKKDLVNNNEIPGDWTPSGEQSFAALRIPSVDGYRLISAKLENGTNVLIDNKIKAFNNITKDSPSLVINVTYAANQPQVHEGHAQLNFVDDSNPSNDLRSYNLHSNGDEGTAISFDSLTQKVDELTGLHYQVTKVTQGRRTITTNLQNVNWGNFSDDEVYFTIHLTHQTEPAHDTKTVNETIKYVYDDGNTAADTKIAHVAFNRIGTKDSVTGHTDWNAWTPVEHTFPAVASPTVENYTPDESEIGAQTVTAKSDNLNFTVTYYKNEEPEKPNKPDHPVTPENPSKPEHPVKPNHPVTPENPSKPDHPVKPEHPVTPENPSKPEHPVKPNHPVNPVQPDQPAIPEQPAGINVTSGSETHPQGSHSAATVKTNRQTMAKNQQSNHKVQLPQTGNQASRLSALGLLGLGFTALLGVISAKRKDE